MINYIQYLLGHLCMNDNSTYFLGFYDEFDLPSAEHTDDDDLGCEELSEPGLDAVIDVCLIKIKLYCMNMRQTKTLMLTSKISQAVCNYKLNMCSIIDCALG